MKKRKNITNLDAIYSQIAQLQSERRLWTEKANEIQSHFNFIIPNYILDEIIEQQHDSNSKNLYYLINCAILNGNLTQENGRRIKEVYQ